VDPQGNMIVLNQLVTSLLVALIVSLAGLIWNTGKKVDRLLEIMGSTDEPTSMLGRLFRLEQDHQTMKEELLRNGFKLPPRRSS